MMRRGRLYALELESPIYSMRLRVLAALNHMFSSIGRTCFSFAFLCTGNCIFTCIDDLVHLSGLKLLKNGGDFCNSYFSKVGIPASAFEVSSFISNAIVV